MAITITKTGSEISTEKYTVTATSDDVLVTSVRLNLHINGTQVDHYIEHLPDLGTTDTFTFEINSIIKDYFNFEFVPLTGANQTFQDNVLVGIEFNEVIGTVVGGASFRDEVIIKNITQDTFEIEDFDLLDYDCGGTNGSVFSKLLTSSPNPLPIGDLTSVHVSCLTTSYDGGLNPLQEWVILQLLDGVLVNTLTSPVTVPTRGITGYITDGKYDISTYRIDFESAKGYDEVQIYIRDINSPFTSRSETRSFKKNDACEKSITLSWFNELGVQDSFTFLGNITRTGKYTDKTFRKIRPVNPLSTNVGDLVYKSDFNYQYDIFSDRMPENHVQWLSKILINKKAAIQTAKPPTPTKPSLLYNWYSLNGGVSGNGRGNGGIVNTSQPNWIVPQDTDWTTLETFLGGSTVAGGEMKEAGLANWIAPNTGATNSSGFTAKGNGMRSGVNGDFFLDDIQTLYWMGNTDGFGNNTRGLDTGVADLTIGTNTNDWGFSVRLMRPAVGGETNGQLLTNAYIGKNGEKYDGIVIGTQVWITRSLYETYYNNGTAIPNETDNTAWSNLTSGAFSSYDNEPIVNPINVPYAGLYFPIVIETEETVLEDKFTPETIFRLKFRLANKRKGLK
jgi:uncharacterized protein (TIGR02145 family)